MSKQADLSTMPRHSNVKPDFQAPGPRVLIEKKIDLDGDSSDDEDDDDDGDDDTPPRIRYYESPKVLGKLYRAIDEQKIFGHIQIQSQQLGSMSSVDSVLDRVWNYVQNATALIQYDHYTVFAKDAKEA